MTAPPTGDPRATVGGKGHRRRWPGLGGRSDGRSEARSTSPRGDPRRQGGRCHTPAGGHASRHAALHRRPLPGALVDHAAGGRPAARQRAAAHRLGARVGWWHPTDPLPPYRLKMSASLEGLGRLSTWWKPRLAPVLADLTDGRVVWDLLPHEHEAAMAWDATTPGRRVTIRFLDAEGKTVSHWNKLLKGSLVRWLLLEQPAGPEALGSFHHPLGYRLDLACFGSRRRRCGRRPPRRLLGSPSDVGPPPLLDRAHPRAGGAGLPPRVGPVRAAVPRDRARRGAHLGAVQLRLDPRARARVTASRSRSSGSPR